MRGARTAPAVRITVSAQPVAAQESWRRFSPARVASRFIPPYPPLGVQAGDADRAREILTAANEKKPDGLAVTSSDMERGAAR